METNLIVITAEHEAELTADAADVRVTVQGSALFTGRTALRKAQEVSRLVSSLEECGLSELDVALEGVEAEQSSGFLGKSSSATYRLRVAVRELDRLPEVMGAITGAKNAKLVGISWRYPESAEEEGRWLAACVTQANIKARAAAAALGVRLAGVHRLTEHQTGDAPQALAAQAFDSDLVRRRESVTLGFKLTHHKRVKTVVTVEYRVEGAGPGQ